ncbi:MAG: SRPBCC family protein, partial [Actinomycetota bacterium]
MKSYQARSTIKADPQTIWAIITDGSGYATWDNGVIRVEGTIKPGKKIKVVSEANPGRTFPV